MRAAWFSAGCLTVVEPAAMRGKSLAAALETWRVERALDRPPDLRANGRRAAWSRPATCKAAPNTVRIGLPSLGKSR